MYVSVFILTRSFETENSSAYRLYTMLSLCHNVCIYTNLKIDFKIIFLAITFRLICNFQKGIITKITSQPKVYYNIRFINAMRYNSLYIIYLILDGIRVYVYEHTDLGLCRIYIIIINKCSSTSFK